MLRKCPISTKRLKLVIGADLLDGLLELVSLVFLLLQLEVQALAALWTMPGKPLLSSVITTLAKCVHIRVVATIV